jgi:glycerol uptake facilitator-like aquaporin
MHIRDLQARPAIFTVWEKTRNKSEVHWLSECFAEMLGVFFYTYIGIGSTAAWNLGNTIKQEGLSSLLQIGLAYGAGIIFAIVVCASTSGGHFSPSITIAFTLFKGFPKLKALRYIVAQIIGAYLASCLVYYQWKPFIEAMELALLSAGETVYDETIFTPNGPAGIFALYLLPGQKVGWAFLNEFVNCVILAIVIWACLDPSSILIPPSTAPWLIGFAYVAIIWGFAVPGIALNTARDVGSRFWAMTIWGQKAAGGSYSAVTALTNIPATLFGVALYEIFLADSDRGKYF